MSHPISPAQQERFDFLIDSILNKNIARIKDLLAKDTPLIFRGVLTTSTKCVYHGYHVFSHRWPADIAAVIAGHILEMDDADFNAMSAVLRNNHYYLAFQQVVSTKTHENLIMKMITRLGFVPSQMRLPSSIAVKCMRAGITHPETQAFTSEIISLENDKKDLLETAGEAVNMSKDLISRVNALEEQLSAANNEVRVIKETFEQERLALQRNLIELQETIGKLSDVCRFFVNK